MGMPLLERERVYLHMRNNNCAHGFALVACMVDEENNVLIPFYYLEKNFWYDLQLTRRSQDVRSAGSDIATAMLRRGLGHVEQANSPLDDAWSFHSRRSSSRTSNSNGAVRSRHRSCWRCNPREVWRECRGGIAERGARTHPRGRSPAVLVGRQRFSPDFYYLSSPPDIRAPFHPLPPTRYSDSLRVSRLVDDGRYVPRFAHVSYSCAAAAAANAVAIQRHFVRDYELWPLWCLRYSLARYQTHLAHTALEREKRKLTRHSENMPFRIGVKRTYSRARIDIQAYNTFNHRLAWLCFIRKDAALRRLVCSASLRRARNAIISDKLISERRKLRARYRVEVINVCCCSSTQNNRTSRESFYPMTTTTTTTTATATMTFDASCTSASIDRLATLPWILGKAFLFDVNELCAMSICACINEAARAPRPCVALLISHRCQRAGERKKSFPLAFKSICLCPREPIFIAFNLNLSAPDEPSITRSQIYRTEVDVRSVQSRYEYLLECAVREILLCYFIREVYYMKLNKL
uniref:Uncharacterized protein n=1 Tax=Trichogramma kaykai TaxID=54128 RepID=A0ABD2VW73_9HYME